MEDAGARQVMLVPFPGQGHLAGFLAVARLLRRELPGAATVTIVCTPRNVAAMRSSSSEETPPPSSSNIAFHALPNQRLLPHVYRTDAVLANTAEELEPTGLAMLRRALGNVPVWPVGPLVRSGTTSDAAAAAGAILCWLDTQPPSSVLYISFGSQNTIRADQMMELAAALESTAKRFLWVIRPPVGFDINGAFRDEVRILAHGATGVFLSHGGWNSVLESLTHGVPVIGWPLAGDQFYNVKMMAKELGVCLEAARGHEETWRARSSKGPRWSMPLRR